MAYRSSEYHITWEETLSEYSSHRNMAPHSETLTQCWQNRIWSWSRFGIYMIIWIVFLGYMVVSNLQKPFYAVIIDAGSTGSRVYTFTFHKSILDASLILDGESFAHVKPGLSSYAEDPVKGAESLTVLLEKAKTSVPKSKWRSTPLSLKATAGLRLLPKEKAHRLLEECEKLLGKSGFLVSEGSVSIMDGTDEGIFSWFTVNFLLGRLTAESRKNTVAALDLGGGSTQVTFAPDSKHIKDHKGPIFTISTVNKNISLYSHSYLGMGLEAARKEILTYGQNIDHRAENSSSVVEVYSECIHPTILTNWSYGGVDYLVKGLMNGTSKVVETRNLAETDKDSSSVMFSECSQVVRNHVNAIVKKPPGLETQEIFAFSYYFDRAQEVGPIDPSIRGTATVDALLQQAMVYCKHPNNKQPFTCLDLTFVYVLLRDGFGLQPTTELQFYSKIDNYKLSWALGAAFSILQNGL